MADTLELASYEQIDILLSQLMTNYNALADNYFNMFYTSNRQKAYSDLLVWKYTRSYSSDAKYSLVSLS